MRKNAKLPWHFYAGTVVLSLVISRLGLPLPFVLAALGGLVVGVILWDKRRAAGKQLRGLPVSGAFEVITDANGYPDLWFALQNTSPTHITLPAMQVSLAYTTHAGGTPARGGNGIDSVKLLDQVPLPARLAAGQSTRIAIDLATTLLAPAPHQITQRRNEDDTVYAARVMRLQTAYDLLCEQLRAAPSLLAFLADNPETFVNIHLEGHHPDWSFSKAQIT